MNFKMDYYSFYIDEFKGKYNKNKISKISSFSSVKLEKKILKYHIILRYKNFKRKSKLPSKISN
jgi:hypothetical protein